MRAVGESILTFNCSQYNEALPAQNASYRSNGLYWESYLCPSPGLVCPLWPGLPAEAVVQEGFSEEEAFRLRSGEGRGGVCSGGWDEEGVAEAHGALSEDQSETSRAGQGVVTLQAGLPLFSTPPPLPCYSRQPNTFAVPYPPLHQGFHIHGPMSANNPMGIGDEYLCPFYR